MDPVARVEATLAAISMPQESDAELGALFETLAAAVANATLPTLASRPTHGHRNGFVTAPL